jgi:hypothetical protein
MTKQRVYGIIALIVALSIAGIYTAFPPRVWMSYKDVSQRYVRALFEGDELAVLDLLPSDDLGFDSDKARQIVKEKVQKYRGKQLKGSEISYKEYKPVALGAKISGTYEDNGQIQPFSEEISVSYGAGPFWRFYRGTWSVGLPGIRKDLGVKPAIVP